VRSGAAVVTDVEAEDVLELAAADDEQPVEARQEHRALFRPSSGARAV